LIRWQTGYQQTMRSGNKTVHAMNKQNQNPKTDAVALERAAWFARLAFGCWDPGLPVPLPKTAKPAANIMP
jgi:hypothetical protein